VHPHYPIQQSYNNSLHTPHVAYSLTESSHTQVDHAARLVKWIQSLQHQVHNSLQQAKQDKPLQQGKHFTKVQIQQKIPHFHGNLTQWGPFIPMGVRMIQAEVDGTHLFHWLKIGVSTLAFFLRFSRLELPGPFLGPKRHFFSSTMPNI
jgi:hypothetical protein